MKKTLIALSIAALSASTSAAEENRPTVEAFLGLDRTDWDEVREVHNDNGINLGGAFNVSNNWALEGWYARSDAESRTSDMEIIVETASINALRYLSEGQTRPFLTVGASQLMFNPDSGSTLKDNTFDLGLGLKHYFENSAVLRGEVIARIFDDETSSSDYNVDPTFRLSIGYAFGGKSKPVKKAMPEPVAPEPVVVAAPVDSDKDGIFDQNDQCPDTAMNLKVDDKGCKILLKGTVEIDLNINFPNNSAEITSAYLSEIQNVADFMNQYAGTIVDIRGYTDDRGSAGYNQQLSEKRAKAVASKLVSDFGIAQSRVQATGYGEADPIADNSTAEGRAQNRRVVANISTEVEKAVIK